MQKDNNTALKVTDLEKENTNPLASKPENSGCGYRRDLTFVIAILVLMTVFSVIIKAVQYRTWQHEPANFSKGIPIMTMHDAYLWLKTARDYKDEILNENFTQIPMISFVAAKGAWFFGNNIHKTAVFFSMIFPVLVIYPLFLYFYRTGYPSAGILGGLAALLSPAYMGRSTIGYYTTDILNLFFPFLAALFILLAVNDKKKYTYIFSGLTGITILIFHWWYPKPGFTTVYFFVLAAFLFVHRIEKRTILYSAIIYLFAANPIHFWQGISHITAFFSMYFFRLVEAGELVFPQAIKTISEAGRTPFMEVLNVISPVPFFLFGLAGLLLFILFFVLVDWRKSLPLMPVFLLGIFTFVSSIRFGMFLVPFVGIGYGCLITFIFNQISKKAGTNSRANAIAACVVSFVIVLVLSLKAEYYQGMPVESSEVYSAYLDFKDSLPKDSTIFTWWDAGYTIKEATGFTVLHDGGNQHGVKTNLIARGFVSDSQRELYNIISLTSRKNNNDMERMIAKTQTHKDLLKALSAYNIPPESRNIFLLFTHDMAGLKTQLDKFGSIQFLGGWGEGHISNKFEPLGATLTNCKVAGENLMKCDNNNEIDKARGLINKTLPIKKIIYIINGRVYEDEKYNTVKEGFYIEMFGDRAGKTLQDLKIYSIKVLNEKMYNTNFNQMYLLGKYDKTRFEEVYNSFPYARLFMVKAME